MTIVVFLDETDWVDAPGRTPDVFAVAGFAISIRDLKSLQSGLHQLKRCHALKPDDPIKWNMKSTALQKHYESRYGRADHALEMSDDLRRGAARLLASKRALVIGSAIGRFAESTAPTQLRDWCLENVLQRLAWVEDALHDERDTTPSMVVCDFPADASKPLSSLYREAYYHGEGYLRGPLSKHGFLDALCYSSTPHSGSLQVADIVVGWVSAFIKWCSSGERRQKARLCCQELLPIVHRSPKGQIAKHGLVIGGQIDCDVDASAAELLAER